MGVISAAGAVIDVGVDSVRFFFDRRVAKLAKGHILARAGVAIVAAVGKRVISTKAQQAIEVTAEKVSTGVDTAILWSYRVMDRRATTYENNIRGLIGVKKRTRTLVFGEELDPAKRRAQIKRRRPSLATRLATSYVADKAGDKIGKEAVTAAIHKALRNRRRMKLK